MTQRAKLRKLFTDNPNRWVSLQQIIYLGIAMYPPRIKELRDIEKMTIINNTKIVDGVKHSSYIYIPSGQFEMNLGA